MTSALSLRRRVRLVVLLDAAEAAGLVPIKILRFHAFAYLSNVLAPVWDLSVFDGKGFKRRGGPFYPALQRDLIRQLHSPKLVVCDTRDFWIEKDRAAQIATLEFVDGIVLNDGEARLLTSQSNLVRAGREILKMGPKFTVIKKGEHGALLVTPERVVMLPAYPTQDVVDPTGAGDSFAGGMIGYLASVDRTDPQALKAAMVRGTIAASFTIESFSLDRIRGVRREEFDERCARYSEMLRCE